MSAPIRAEPEKSRPGPTAACSQATSMALAGRWQSSEALTLTHSGCLRHQGQGGTATQSTQAILSCKNKPKLFQQLCHINLSNKMAITAKKSTSITPPPSACLELVLAQQLSHYTWQAGWDSSASSQSGLGLATKLPGTDKWASLGIVLGEHVAAALFRS